MKRKPNLPLIAWICCLAVMLAAMSFAYGVQTDFGNVEVTAGALDTEDGVVTYKLYRPATASEANPAPAVLLMHGYQNDKDTSAAYALELARRGIVALAIDSYGHGGTSTGMLARGYTHHKLPNWDKTVNGPERFLLMMNFNTSDFFTNLADVPGDTLGDTSMDGRAMYAYLGSLPFVDAQNLGVTGHSMGTWSSWSVAASYPDHKAIVLQCGELFPKSYYDSDSISFHNVLLLQSRYDEFTCFLDYTKSVPDELVNTELRYGEFANQSGPIEWDKTYGSFADGSARRMELITNANHRLVTINAHAIATTMDWFLDAFDKAAPIDSYNQTALLLETLQFVGLLAALASVLPLMRLLLKTKYFAPCASPMPNRVETLMPRKKWWGAALTAILISGLTYPFLTQLGHGLVPLPENVFRMTIGDGVITWFVFLSLVAFFMLRHWLRRGAGKREGATLYDLGLATKESPKRLPWGMIGKSTLLAVILVGSVYAYAEVFMRFFSLDFRFVWPLLKPFTLERFWQFLLYLPFYLVFFLINGGAKLYGQLRLPECKRPAATQLVWWLKGSLVMIGGLLLVCLIEYIPYFSGIGPGMDLLFSSTFGGPFISFLIVIIPQFILLFFLSTYAFRKTGRVYVGSVMLALFATWAVTAGSSML
jgi:dienelactone hydrolase